jgi:hypothetical protein
MKIAGYSGHNFHYEMFGYIIDYCKKNKYELTIYCKKEFDEGYIDMYNNIFSNYNVDYKEFYLLNTEINNYNIVILFSDCDKSYTSTKNNVICIDHYYISRSPNINKHIANRPYKENYRDWALPCYPIIEDRIYQNNYNIAIINSVITKYNINIINRLKCPQKINIHAVSRNINISHFDGINNDKFNIILHKSPTALQLLNIINQCNYILTDISYDKPYEDKIMSGAIPFSFSTLRILIISKQTNQYYKFKNVIEFDKNSTDDIILKEIDFNKIKEERDILIKNNHELISKYINKI